MTLKRHIIILLPVLLLSTGCTCGSGKSNEKQQFPKQFPYPTVPSMIAGSDAGLSYAATHFWDSYADSSAVWAEFDDSTRIGGVSKEVFHNVFTEYVSLLWQIPVADALAAQSNAVGQTGKNVKVFECFVRMCEECLYGANSDFRNEEFYIPILENLINSTVNSELTIPIMKQKYAEDLAECSKNRVNTTAADFRFRTADGKTGTLHSIRSDYTLIFFSNPGCTACREIIDMLKGSDDVSAMISSGKLTVLNIYIDEDLGEWFKYMPAYPKEWINAYQYDLKVRHGGLYSVRAIPCLYLLDGEKKVILKDVPPPILMQSITNH